MLPLLRTAEKGRGGSGEGKSQGLVGMQGHGGKRNRRKREVRAGSVKLPFQFNLPHVKKRKAKNTTRSQNFDVD